MKKYIYSIILAAVAFLAQPAQAQINDSYFSYYYSMGLGTGKTNDYISRYSWRGMGFDYKSEVTDNIMAGFGADWNVFYQDMAYGTYTRDNIALSGKQYRYLNSFPMAIKLNYFKDTDAGVRVFGGAGVGTTYTMQDIDMGQYRFSTNTWQFLVAPELGLTYDMDASRSLLLSVKYNYNFKNSELEARPYLSFNVGFSFNQ